MTAAGAGGDAARRSVPPAPPELVDAVDASLVDANVMDRGGYPYVVHPLTDGVPRCQPDLLAAWVDWAAGQPFVRDATLILAPEAMGLPLMAPLSLRLGLPYVIVRKRKYDLPGEEVAYCETGYGEACLHVNDVWPDDKVLVVDDVVSTGGTLDGLLSTLAAMQVPVVGVLLFLDKGRKLGELEERHNVPIHPFRRIRIEDGKVRVVATD